MDLVVKFPIFAFFTMSGSMSMVIGLLNVRVEGSLVFKKCFSVVWRNHASGPSKKNFPRLNFNSEARAKT